MPAPALRGWIGAGGGSGERARPIAGATANEAAGARLFARPTKTLGAGDAEQVANGTPVPPIHAPASERIAPLTSTYRGCRNCALRNIGRNTR
jgi:hypothetical protein